MNIKINNSIKLIICFIVSVAMLGYLASCSNKNKVAGQKEDKTDKRRPNTFVFGVTATTVNPSVIEEIITIGGDIQAVNAVSVTPDTAGTLDRLLVVEGQKVRKGETIAYVDPSKAGQNFLPSPVKAPISGIVSSLPTKVGNSINVQQVIATIADNSEVEMKLSIPEKYISKLSKESKGVLSLISFPHQTFAMSVKTLSSVLSSNTHTMPVTMKFDEISDDIRSGMYGSLDLILERKEEVLVLPRDVIVIRLVENKNTLGVFVVNDITSTEITDNQEDIKTVRFATVEIGLETNNQVEIVSGLNAGNIVVTQGQNSLSDGSVVRIFTLDNKELISVEDEIKRLQEQQNEGKTSDQKE